MRSEVHPLTTEESDEMKRKDLERIADTRSPSHSGILVDACKGDKWICQYEDAVLAVTYSYCVGGCGIFGDVISSEMAESFFAEVFGGLRQNGLDDFEFSSEDEKLTKWVLEIFKNKTIYSEMELSYRYLNKEAAPPPRIGKREYTIYPIDEQLMGSISAFENTELLQERMTHSWEPESFFHNSVGFAAVVQNRMIGLIFGSGRYREYLSIDIEVEKEFQRRGIAHALTNCFVMECQKRSIVPQWDCVASNVASQMLAEKSGFKLIKKRPYYWFEI